MEKQRRARPKIKRSTPNAGNETAAAKQRPTRPKLKKPPPLRGPCRPRADFRRLGPMPIPPEKAKFSRIRRARVISSVDPLLPRTRTAEIHAASHDFVRFPSEADPSIGSLILRGRGSDPLPRGFSQNSARSAEFQRNLHLRGAIGRDFAPHGSVACCVGISPRNP